jgi:hypothetical protein
VGLFDHVLPSERASDLALLVRRIRKRTGLDVVPMVVVEGRTDEPPLSALCRLGEAQVFSAGTRTLVEQLLVHLENQPIAGCDCVYLVDCDGVGKTAQLSGREQLVVTETCDLEADLVKIGVALRVVTPFVADGNQADALISSATRTALSLSIIRRAASRARISMKRDGRQLRLCDLPEAVLASWEESTPHDADVIAAVALEMVWDTATTHAVTAELGNIARNANASALGKDILDALFRAVQRAGHGNVRGWSRDYFHQTIRRALGPEDVAGWVVGERITRWADTGGHDLLL